MHISCNLINIPIIADAHKHINVQDTKILLDMCKLYNLTNILIKKPFLHTVHSLNFLSTNYLFYIFIKLCFLAVKCIIIHFALLFAK